LVEGGRWHGEVLLDAWHIGELDVHPADLFVADEFLDAFWGGVFASGVELTHGVSLRFLAFVVCKSCSYSVVYQFSRSEEHTSELQSRFDLVCRLLLEKKKIHY